MKTFSYLIEVYLEEAFDLPKTVPEYTTSEAFSSKIRLISIPSIDINVTIKPYGGTWSVDFEDVTTGMELTGKNDLTVIPKVMAVIQDYIKKSKDKPSTIKFTGKMEANGKDSISIINQKKLQDLLLLIKRIKFKNKNLDEIFKMIKDNKFLHHPGNIGDEIENDITIFEDSISDEDYSLLKELAADLQTLKHSDITEKNRRADIYVNLINRYWPSAEIEKEGNVVNATL